MRIVKAPEPANLQTKELAVFLAGSIEMGSAENWQEEITKQIGGLFDVVLNPRRDDWDSSWEQKASNPKFREQVLWELENLREADYIIMYFSPGTKSPITLLELGYMAGSTNLHVVCPDGYWRKGNVEITCEDTGTPFYNSMEECITKLKQLLNEN